MKFMVLEGKSNVGNYRYKMVGTIEASSLEIASDLVYKKFRQVVNKKDGETYVIIPDNEIKNSQNITYLPLEGVPYSMIKYWEPG